MLLAASSAKVAGHPLADEMLAEQRGALVPFRDPGFSRHQADKIRDLVARRTKELPPGDFVDMMRSAIKEDEWMLYAHGAVMGAAGGFLHLAVFTWNLLGIF